MSGITKLMTAGGGGVSLTPASSIASDVTVQVPSVNGTLVNTGSTGQVTSSMLATAITPLGVGQTWQNVAGSRALGTTYTNSTGRSIFVAVSVNQNNSGVGISITIDGVSINAHQDNGNASNGSAYFVIPNGSTYYIQSQVGENINSWLELR